MPSFTTRVELHDANWDDYEKLHKYMEAEGFKRTITSDDGVTYHLPTAEYDLVTSSMNRGQVLEKARTAAIKTSKKFAVLVTESAGRTWHDLERAS